MANARNLQYSAINTSSSGNTTIVAAQTVAGQPAFIKIWALWIVIAGITNITFYDGITALSGAAPMVANGSMFFAPGTVPWLTASPNNAFIMNSSAGVQISGGVVWSL